MHPVLDPSKLSDEEILEKMMKCYSMLSTYESLGHNEMCSSIRLVIETLQFEKDNREMTKFNKELATKKGYSEPIELGKLEDIDALVEKARKLK